MSSPAVVSSRPVKRRKVENGEFVKLSNSYVELRRRREVVIESENLLNSGEDKVDCGRTIMEVECSSPSSDHVQASCCSSNGSSELDAEEDRIKFVDLEEDDESVEVETSMYISCRRRREMTSSSRLRGESEEVESAPKPAVVDSCQRSVVEKMPTETELEDFFAAAEKDIQKRFTDKYNYDFVKEAPLEGRYEWVRLKP
ncbi:hypothetical protein UlMin_039266 [Ulmus minor]